MIRGRIILPALLCGLVAGLAGVAPLKGQPVAQEDDGEVRQAQQLLAARCAICHSTDLIAQQRLPRDRWEATLDKMAHWGAQLDAAEKSVLLGYLAARLHPEAGPVALLPEAPPSGASGPSLRRGVAARGAALYRSNCLPCHGEKAQGGVGPQLAGNPILSQGAQFYDTVWNGRGAMPSWGRTLEPQDIADIHAWLKTF